MKTILLLTALLLCCTPAFGKGQEKLPPAQRISAEKLILAEKYRNAAKKCREHDRKRSKDNCLEQRKEEFLRSIGDLERNPGAYFSAQEKNVLDKKALQERTPR